MRSARFPLTSRALFEDACRRHFSKAPSEGAFRRRPLEMRPAHFPRNLRRPIPNTPSAHFPSASRAPPAHFPNTSRALPAHVSKPPYRDPFCKRGPRAPRALSEHFPRTSRALSEDAFRRHHPKTPSEDTARRHRPELQSVHFPRTFHTLSGNPTRALSAHFPGTLSGGIFRRRCPHSARALSVKRYPRTFRKRSPGTLSGEPTRAHSTHCPQNFPGTLSGDTTRRLSALFPKTLPAHFP